MTRALDAPAPQPAASGKVEADVRERNVHAFTRAVLHGDDEHRAWLLEAADAFVEGRALPPPRGKGTSPTLAQPGAEADAAEYARGRHDLAREVYALHEDTIEKCHDVAQQDTETKWGAFARGRCMEAKSIARAIAGVVGPKPPEPRGKGPGAEERDRLREEAASWRRVAERCEGEKQAAEAALATTRQECDALREALGFYATPDNWYRNRPDGDPVVAIQCGSLNIKDNSSKGLTVAIADCGIRARAALTRPDARQEASR